jgi:hypothetical protein
LSGNIIRDRARELRRLGTSYALLAAELGISRKQARRWTYDVDIAGGVVRDIEGNAWPKWTPGRSAGNIDGSGI